MNELLDECNVNAKALVDEIEKYKNAAEVNRTAAESLRKVSDAITELTKQIRPLTGITFRRFRWTMFTWTALNTVMVFTIIMMLLKKS